MAQRDAVESTPGGLELSRAQMNVIFVTIMLGMLVSALDQHVFLFAVPIAVVGLLLALVLPQVAMRGVARVIGAGDGFAVPEGSDNETQPANVVAEILRRDNRSSFAGILAGSGSALDIPTAWG